MLRIMRQVDAVITVAQRSHGAIHRDGVSVDQNRNNGAAVHLCCSRNSGIPNISNGHSRKLLQFVTRVQALCEMDMNDHLVYVRPKEIMCFMGKVNYVIKILVQCRIIMLCKMCCAVTYGVSH